MQSRSGSGPINKAGTYYYNYDFISAEGLYAEIKEEMKSYFSTGVVDDTMFPLYTEKALSKLGRSGYKIVETVVEVSGYQGTLPNDFFSERGVWACANVIYNISLPSATYMEDHCTVTHTDNPNNCNSPTCETTYYRYHKITGSLMYSFTLSQQLFPGRRNDSGSYHIEGCHIHTLFSDGLLLLQYYVKDTDENQYQLIPDNYRISEYIKAFIKFKIYEQLYNEVTDETFNQIERKYQNYKQEYLDAYIMADAEIKKQTIFQKINSINRQRRALYPYIIR